MDIKDIISRVNKLDNKEKVHILNILKTHNVDFTKNRNGYFFNLSSVNDEIVLKISKCLDLIESNRDLIRKIDKRRDELLEYYKKIIQEKISNKVKKMTEEYNKKLLLYKVETSIMMDIKNISKRINTSIGDPDDMIKEYSKNLYKYEKNSVYANIISKIKAYNSSHRNLDKKVKDRSEGYEDMEDMKFSDYNTMDDYYMNDDIIEDDMIDDMIDDSPIDNPVDDENVDDISNDDEYETHCSDEVSYMDEVYNDNIENDDVEIDDEEVKKEDIEMETNINYYKNLLSKKGYSFDDNKNCMLGYQEYIK